ncbi:MAG: hypothetical protein L0K47_00715 [Acidipropionibacterium jensenii]|uniref:hypothetical protein n=1 Tax=Acidipropionibacterium jensenii TaxID=1749 RepID=UPI002647C24C|nr:hypothetical protein [Acidipropionibacterium jensenii]MDN6511855.1 hypothetical protein [Acidipropionibacterium jensenii]
MTAGRQASSGRARNGAPADAKSSSGPRRGRKPGHRVVGVRFSYPIADTSVATWLECQDSISESLRALIRESIERDGYLDLANRPLAQQPRKGRPPAESAGAVPVVPAGPPPGAAEAPAIDEDDEADEVASPAAPPPPAPSRPDPDADSGSDDAGAGGSPIADDVVDAPAADGDDPVVDVNSSEPGKQFSVDDINELLRSSRQ